jgi:uncharacterized membrane protein YbhN (UPF0104 family)
MVKASKKGGILFAVGKLLLFLAFCFYLVHQTGKMDWDFSFLEEFNPFYFFISFLLVIPNWYCEWMKWKLTLRVANVRTSPFETANSFMAGIISGMLTPNMIGNFVGRLMYYSKRSRISITVLTLLTNYGQFLASMIAGFVSLLFLGRSPFGVAPQQLVLFGGLALMFLFVGYFYFDFFFKVAFPRKMRLFYRLRDLRERVGYKWTIIAISIVRLLIFTLQMVLILGAFGVAMNQELFFWIWQYYFWVTLTPSLLLGKVIIRDSVAVWVLTSIMIPGPAILFSSFSIWVINLVLPTLVSIVFIKRKSIS